LGDQCKTGKQLVKLFWALVMAFSMSALVGGYFTGRGTMVDANRVTHRVIPSSAPQHDEIPRDEFAGDPAVAAQVPGGSPGQEASLAIVLVDAGDSAALASPFLLLNIPVTVVVDPASRQAQSIVTLAQQSSQTLYLQAHEPLTPAAIDALHARFPGASGIALRLNAPPSAATRSELRREGLRLFDEYGEVPIADDGTIAVRTVTVDDHAQTGYVRYMLHQAVRLARGARAAVLIRPFPSSLRALDELIAGRSREGVRFVDLR
jgi:hypothetical protein